MILPRFDVQGHRGARAVRPENTLPSFEAALDAGATSIETDVHLTADAVPVLYHDPLISDAICRLAAVNREPAPHPDTLPAIRRLRAAQLRNYSAHLNPNPVRFPRQAVEPSPAAERYAASDGRPYAIPTLRDLYLFVAAYAGEPGRRDGKTVEQRVNAARLTFDVEIKGVPFREEDAAAVEQAIVDVIHSVNAARVTRVRSFDHRCIQRLCAAEPELTGVVLIEGTAPVNPAEIARAAGARVYAPDYLFLDERQVRQCHDVGIAVIPWTVNAPADWERLLSWGVDGVTTDDPAALRQYLASGAA